MSRACLLIACVGILSASPAIAAEYLTDVTSEVYEAAGTPKEIATRATTCISQHLAPGSTDSQLIISSDLDGGTVVARNALEYTGGLVRWRIRSNLTFEAREGRFRIRQTNLERFNDQFNVGWAGIGKWPGSQWKKAEETFKASANAVAQCVITGPHKDNW